MGYQETWVAAKRAFEQATNKKKPSAGFLSYSGVEPATKELDKVLARPEAQAIAKAEQGYHKVHQDYLKTLEKARQSDKKSDEYKAEVEKLIKSLEDIAVDFSEKKKGALLGAEQAKGKAVFDACQNALIEVLGLRREAVKSALGAERALVGAAGGDDKARKTAGDAAKAAAKAIEDGKKKADGIWKKAATDRTNNLKKVDQKVFPVHNGRSDYQKFDEESFAAVSQMEIVVENMGELLEGARAAEAAAKAAAVDDAACLASADRFARVVPTACEAVDSALRTAGGMADLANMEKLNANEMDAGPRKDQLLARSREIAGRGNMLAEQIESDIQTFQEAFEGYRDALPNGVRTSNDAKDAMDNLTEGVRGFGPNREELAKIKTKLARLR